MRYYLYDGAVTVEGSPPCSSGTVDPTISPTTATLPLSANCGYAARVKLVVDEIGYLPVSQGQELLMALAVSRCLRSGT